MASEIRTRDQIDPRYQWDLTHIFPSDEAWEAALTELAEEAKRCAGWNGKVAENPKQAIRDIFALDEHAEPVRCYAFLRKETDNADETAQALMARVSALGVELSTAVSFLEPELNELPDEDLTALMNDPEMADYSEFLRGLLRMKAHALPKDQERLMSMMGEVTRVSNNVFDMLTGVDMKFPDVVMPDGSTRPLTEGTYSAFIRHPDRDVRRQAFEGIMGTYDKMGATIAATYGGRVKTDVFLARARNYASARAAKMEPLEIPESVYDNLIDVIHENLPTLNEYLQLRKEKMGLDELHMYDLYTPLVTDVDMTLPYDKAYDLVLEGLQPMGEDYVAKLREARTGGWIDVYPSKNKSSGAFSMGTMGKVHPYVLLNHNDNLADTFTIAHELGHSMHSFYSNQTQPQPKADYSLFVAEVASTCNEAVMMRHLLNTLTDRKARAYLLNHRLEQFRTTCFRQTMFAEFERISHNMAETNQPLTRTALTDAYYKLNQQFYGGACEVDKLIGAEWMRIPHFYRPFYVYVYATGLCAAVTLSAKILTEGESAVRDYRKFLSAGCSVPPIEALKLAGIDMSSPEPIRRAMEVFKETLAEFKTVL
ncbi:MAG: oligoendopeptidase F [Christensenellaceae bacterium]|nr:oligoendopeptidase F [Christensenellaceae bacterium]